jgi:hypothetical protein
VRLEFGAFCFAVSFGLFASSSTKLTAKQAITSDNEPFPDRVSGNHMYIFYPSGYLYTANVRTKYPHGVLLSREEDAEPAAYLLNIL